MTICLLLFLVLCHIHYNQRALYVTSLTTVLSYRGQPLPPSMMPVPLSLELYSQCVSPRKSQGTYHLGFSGLNSKYWSDGQEGMCSRSEGDTYILQDRDTLALTSNKWANFDKTKKLHWWWYHQSMSHIFFIRDSTLVQQNLKVEN